MTCGQATLLTLPCSGPHVLRLGGVVCVCLFEALIDRTRGTCSSHPPSSCDEGRRFRGSQRVMYGRRALRAKSCQVICLLPSSCCLHFWASPRSACSREGARACQFARFSSENRFFPWWSSFALALCSSCHLLSPLAASRGGFVEVPAVDYLPSDCSRTLRSSPAA